VRWQREAPALAARQYCTTLIAIGFSFTSGSVIAIAPNSMQPNIAGFKGDGKFPSQLGAARRGKVPRLGSAPHNPRRRQPSWDQGHRWVHPCTPRTPALPHVGFAASSSALGRRSAIASCLSIGEHHQHLPRPQHPQEGHPLRGQDVFLPQLFLADAGAPPGDLGDL